MFRKDGSKTAAPVQIHNKLTEAFGGHFVCPPHHMHSPLQSGDGIEHEIFLTDKDYFKTTGHISITKYLKMR